MEILEPLWPAPDNVIAGVTTRNLSKLRSDIAPAPYDDFNLALHVDDNPVQVLKNREALSENLTSRYIDLQTKTTWNWLSQTHSNTVVEATPDQTGGPRTTVEADACWSRESGQVCVVLTADCLPVLLADRHGRAVAAIHAGWRGLLNGVIENCVTEICQPQYKHSKHQEAQQSPIKSLIKPPIKPIELFAWLGPAIGPKAFEVGPEVYEQFCSARFTRSIPISTVQQAFSKKPEPNTQKFDCDIYQLATTALHVAGVKQIYGGGYCTFTQRKQFYSYRRDKRTGRMASFILLKSTQSSNV